MKMFKKALLVASLGLASSVSYANNSDLKNYIVSADIESAEMQQVMSLDYVKKVKKLSSGFTVVSVGQDSEASLVQFFSFSGIDFENDVKITIKQPDAKYFDRYLKSSEVTTQMVVSDPLLESQKNLDYNTLLDAINYSREPKEQPNVLILDTGSYGHEDVYFEGGYSFSTVDEENEERTSFDYLDYTGERACMSGHGVAMAGIIGAKTGNNVGIAGIADADLYMGRVVSTVCDESGNKEDYGTLVDLVAAMDSVGDNSSSGIPSPDVVNISLAAESVCPAYLQEAINTLVENGSVVVVSAGNNSGLSSNYTPGNCANVINVGAHTEDGQRSSFTNYGENLDLTTLGTQFTTTASISTGTDYGTSTGTSGSAATVSGVVAIIKSQYPDVEPSKIEDVLKWSSTPYESDSTCSTSCGSGMLNAKAALVMADKLFDPNITYRHAFDLVDPNDSGSIGDQCEAERQVDGLSSYIKTCKAVVAEMDLSYVASSEPVEYVFKVERQLYEGADVGSWEQYGELFRPEIGNTNLPILNVEPSKYNYRVTSCFEMGEELVCPYPKEADFSGMEFPDVCP